MHRRKSLLAAVSLVSLAGLALTACTSGSSNTGASGNAGSNSTLTIGLSNTLPSLDPQASFAQVNRTILYDGAVSEQLYASDPKTGAPMPLLATGFTHPSSSEYDFTLRKGVTFQNGEPFDAAAAVYSIKRFINPATKASGIGYLAPVVKSVAALNTYTLQITTNGPVSNLTRLLITVNMVPPKYSASSPTALAQRPIGTGPYEYKSSTSDSVTLVAYPKYWGPKPAIKTIVLDAMPDDQSRVAALETGQIDIAQNVPTTSVEQAPDVVTQTEPEIAFLRYNATRGLTANPKLREALNLATNRDQLRTALIGSQYSQPLACQFGYSGIEGYNSALQQQPYNLAEAKSIVSSLGDTGKTISVVMPSAQYGTQAVQYMQALASAWESIGLKVNLDVTNAATFTKSLDSGTSSPDVTFINVSDAQFDMGQPYAQMISPQSDVAAYDPSSLNATDALINQANAATTQAARASSLAQAGTLICNSNSFDFLYVPTFVYGKQKNVEWEQRLDGQIYLNTLRFTN